MQIKYLKTVGFRKFKKEFETNLYDITEISGKNRSGKSNILYAIINIMLGTSISGDEKTCLINEKCDTSYGELHFIDNQGVNHVLIRVKHRIDSKSNFVSLDGKPVTQAELTSFYKDKKLFLSIINPLYFLNKKPAEQKEMIDKYLSDIRPKEIFDKLDNEKKEFILKKYFKIPLKDIYSRLDNEELKEIYYDYKVNELTGTEFERLFSDALQDCLSSVILKDIKYYYVLTEKEQTDFINYHIFNIFMDIAYYNLSIEEQQVLEGIPQDIPTYINELNSNIKRAEQAISSLNGKIEYAQNIVNEKLPAHKTFEKDVELSLARQELSFLNTNQNIVNKEKQKQTVDNLEKDILNKETEIIELEKRMKNGKKNYLEIKSGANCSCPTCGQHIEDASKTKTIQNMKQTLTADFNRKNLLDTQNKDLKSKLIVERCKYHALEGETTIEKNKQIAVIEENIKKLETEKLDIEKYNNEISIKETNIKNAKSDIKKFDAEIISQEKFIMSNKNAKEVAQKLYINYIEEKMKLAKQHLKDVNIKFYSVLKTTGEIKENFIITYDGRPLQDLSRSETIATAIEFANMFNKISNTNFPIFIDDVESCADYNFIQKYSNNSQLIISKVEKGSPLKISNYNNSENYTIIKPAITGYRTMKLYKNNANAVPKAA